MDTTEEETLARQLPSWVDPPGTAGRGVSRAGVAGWAIFGLLIGLLAGFLLFYEDPDAALLQAQQAVREQDELIAELNSQLEIFESELNRLNPDAAERARRDQALAQREAALAQREQALAAREAAVTEQERRLEGLWTIPKVDFPSAEDVIAFFNRIGDWFASTVGADESLDDATRPGVPAAP